ALDGLTFTLSCAGQPDGVWYPVLMLREWTAAGWVTRDYTAFAPSGAAAPLAAAPVAQAPAVETAPLAEAPVIEAPVAAPAVVEPAPAVKPVKARKAKAAASGPAVSVNTSTVTALAEVKGISKTVAAAIVAARPYASLDDLLRAKGVGAKLLEKLRAQLTL
ncbi:MAG: helix-hairpin-helix domain-containing protein, partial [Proteobacteria bacterium]|nr:helix-hairpin-helix domain-containing protein [Pseudomonadota bacterium]